MTFQFSKTSQSLALNSSRIVLISLALAGLCLLAWLLWFGFGNVTVYEVSRQARLEVGSAPREVSSLLAGRLTRNQIVIGQRVQAGDVLMELEFDPPAAAPRGSPGQASALSRQDRVAEERDRLSRPGHGE